MHVPGPSVSSGPTVTELFSPSFSLQRLMGNRAFGEMLGGDVLQRKCACGGTCSHCQEEEELHRKEASGTEAPKGNERLRLVQDVLRSSGQPLDGTTRSFMESRFGEDFSQVRVHTDAKAAESARAVNASAYTVGQNVVFANGQYTPSQNSGLRLLAHELTHTIQQGTGSQTNSVQRIGDPATPLEREADQAAESITRGNTYYPELSTDLLISRQGPAPAAGVTPPSPPPPTAEAGPKLSDDDLAEAGIIALANMLQKAGDVTGVFRDIYNQGKVAIETKIAEMRAAGVPEAEIAEKASTMRTQLAEDVRKASGAVLKKAAELFDLVRGNKERPGYVSLRGLGKTDAQIIRSAVKTNKFINALPSGLKWTGRAMWVVAAAISIYLVIEAPPEKKVEVAAHEAGGFAGGLVGGAVGELACIAVGVATEGIGLIVCGLVGGALGVAAGGAAPAGMTKVAETQIEMLKKCEKYEHWWERAVCNIGAASLSKPPL